MGILEELRVATVRVAERAGPAVVGIGQRWGYGSGVVYSVGKVLTNAHNIRHEEVVVTFPDGRKETGRPAGVDPEGDLAVLEVDTGDVTPLEWASETDSAGLGAAVFALSNPGGRGLRVTFGLVSGTQRSFRGPRGRRIAGSLEHTAPLLPGSSGGPIVDAEGRFLGLNTHRLGEGFYLAMPVDASFRERAEALARGESPKRARLGVMVSPPEVSWQLRRAVGLPEADGLLVRDVEEGGPAARAGVREGDLIVRVAGREVPTTDELHAALAPLDGGGALELELLRGTESVTIEVTFPGEKQ